MDVAVNQSPVSESTSFRIDLTQTGALLGVTYRIEHFLVAMDGCYNVLSSVVSNDLSYVTVTVDQPLREGFYSASYGFDFFAAYDFSLYNGGDLLLSGSVENQIGNGGFFFFEAVAVPEPSAYAAWLGLFALGFGVSRRRK